jgi:hypothetical protein
MCVSAWVNSIFQFRVIYFWYLECNSSYAIWKKNHYSCIDITFLIVVMLFEKGTFFDCQTLNDIFDCDDVGTMSSCFYFTEWNCGSYFSEWNCGSDFSEWNCCSYFSEWNCDSYFTEENCGSYFTLKSQYTVFQGHLCNKYTFNYFIDPVNEQKLYQNRSMITNRQIDQYNKWL